MSTETKIALLGEYDPSFPPHAATERAIRHSSDALGIAVDADWVSTADISPDLLDSYNGIWVAPGSPYKNMEKTLLAIRIARTNGKPCFGTCGGFQHILIEYARNVLGFNDATHAEYDPYASELFISELACSLAGREMSLKFAHGSRTADIYGTTTAREQYYCNFGVNPDRVEDIKGGELVISGSDQEGEIRVVELKEHPFFIATLFVPQARSRADAPHPLVSAFIQASAGA